MTKQEKINYYIYKKDRLLVKKDSSSFVVPGEKDFNEDILSQYTNFYLGEYDLRKCYAVEVDENFSILPDFSFEKLYKFRRYYNEKNYRMASKAFLILNWNRKHKYCGVCGNLMGPVQQDMSKICSECNNTIYPNIAPAIIVAIFRGDEILLAHNSNFNDNMYSIIAGFVEPGETFEEAVKREIAEEVSIRVKNISYFGSQPWPFPNSLMIGFTAEYDSGEIEVDGEEILAADWYTPDCFPVLPGRGSVARKIIEWYVEKYNQDSDI